MNTIFFRNNRAYGGLFLLTLLFAFTAGSSCSKNSVHSQKYLLMGTTVEITVAGENKTVAEKALSRAFGEIKRVDCLMSYFDDNSLLSRLNALAVKGPVRVNKELYYVIDKCLEFAKITEGAFDVTATSLDKAGGYREVILGAEERTIHFKNDKVKIDLSAAAKGYAVDRAVFVLREDGIKNALVNAGGDMRAIGCFGKRNWAVGVRDPKLKNKITRAVFLADKAVATSGNYLRDHIIRTGTGAGKENILSSTVIASDCLTADILATSLFVMGRKGINLIENLEEVEALLIIERDGKAEFIESSGFSNYKDK
ncbi:MAG: FAD:protein FMN transferase [Candidatus Omnitrophica bacterium]|nr:FAD:protein FMN transferase [Candidatus Omnitrophota bacterium]